MKSQIGSEESEMPDRSNQFLYRKYAAAQSSGAEVCITLPLTQRGRVPLPEVLLCAPEWVGQIAVLLVRSIDIVPALELSVSGRLTNAKAEDRALRRRNSSAVRSGIQRRARPLRWPIESWPKAKNLGARDSPPFVNRKNRARSRDKGWRKGLRPSLNALRSRLRQPRSPCSCLRVAPRRFAVAIARV
jgi:hypothetical protein